MNVATSKSLRLYETAFTAHAQLADAPALQAELSFTSYVLQRQRATVGTSMEQANRARSLMFTSRMPHDSFLQLIVDSAVPMDTATDDDDDANGSEPRELRGRIDTSSGRLLTTDLCEQVWEAQLAREEAARLSQERRRAAAEAEGSWPDRYCPLRVRIHARCGCRVCQPVLVAFAREQGVTGYSEASQVHRGRAQARAAAAAGRPTPSARRRHAVGCATNADRASRRSETRSSSRATGRGRSRPAADEHAELRSSPAACGPSAGIRAAVAGAKPAGVPPGAVSNRSGCADRAQSSSSRLFAQLSAPAPRCRCRTRGRCRTSSHDRSPIVPPPQR